MRTTPKDSNPFKLSFPKPSAIRGAKIHENTGNSRCCFRPRFSTGLSLSIWCLSVFLLVPNAPARQASYDQALSAAQSALDHEDYNEAISQSGKALEARPNDLAARGLQAEALKGVRHQKNHEIAMAKARKAMADGDYETAVDLMTLVATGWPDDQAAKELLSQAEKARTDRPDYSVELNAGRRALKRSDYDVAVARANLALKLRPNDPAANDVLLRASLAKTMQWGPAPTVAPSPSPNPVSEIPPLAVSGDLSISDGPAPKPPAPKKNEVSVSGDFFLGQGTVTVPFGYSLAASLGPDSGVKGKPLSAQRDSSYSGGTISYSYLRTWFLDLAYAQGSSGGESLDIKTSFGHLSSKFRIDDQYYQAYIRYNVRALSSGPFSAYLRGGITYDTAALSDIGKVPNLGPYTQDTRSTDLLGNLGFGVTYRIHNWRHFRLGAQIEIEGFFGTRSQNTHEVLAADAELGLPFKSVNINNTLYGGIGRGTLHAEYQIGRSDARLFGEGGVQGKYTLISYPGASAPNELLWGPYVKLGLQYAF